MIKDNKIVQRIKNCYVGDNCIQTMVPYSKNISIFSENGIMYSHIVGENIRVNKYLEDERRHQFPYSNIPIHRQKYGFFKSINWANQLFEFEKSYVRIVDGEIIESFVVKDNDSALLIKKGMSSFKRIGYRTREELEKMFQQPDDENQNLYIITLNNQERIYSYSDEKLVNIVKETVSKRFNNTKQYFDNLTTDFFKKSIDNISIDSIPEGINIANNILFIKTTGDNIEMQLVSIYFMKKDHFKVITLDIPVTKYTLEQIKLLTPTIIESKEPKIPLKLNPNVTRKDIEEAKRLVKSFEGEKLV